jgi:capsular polysaccharide biosynthesis protein
VTEQPLDIRTTLKGVWRRRLLVGVLAFVGLCGGLGYGVIRPQLPRAVTLVLLPPSARTSAGLPVRDMTTQIVVATSNPVLAPAGHAVSPPVSAADLTREISVKALSQQVLQVEVAAPRSRDAVALANAIARSYVHYVSQVLPGGADGGPVEILQPATSALPASKLHIPILAGIAFGAGLLAGLVLAAVLSSRDHRLRSRDEIARAIGVPVLASLEAKPCRSVAQWRSLLDDFVPSPVVSWSLRRLLHRLAPAGAGATQEIRVVAFAADWAAMAAGTQLATVATTLGISTVFVPGDEEVLVPLRAACAAHHRSGHRPELHTLGPALSNAGDAGEPPLGGVSSETEDVISRTDHPELTVSLLAVDRSNPAVRPFGGTNVLSVSAGFATADDLARLALAAADAAQAVDGILVVNPDPQDGTTGSTGDGEVQQRMLTSVNRSGAEHTVGRSR